MSPAKRLSRQRFRALCERCRAYLASDAPSDWRAFRHYVALVRACKRTGRGPYTAYESIKYLKWQKNIELTD